MIDSKFADSPAVLAIYKEENKEALDELIKLCEDKLHFIVNLDLKEYLDPRAYGERETNALQFGEYADHRNRAMAGFVIKLIHSMGSGGGDLPSSITSQGTWAGCRVKICAAEDVEDFESFKDVSNAEDVSLLEVCMHRYK